MGITEILRRIWLFSASKIKSFESFIKKPTPLVLEFNSSLRHIIVTFFYNQLFLQFRNCTKFSYSNFLKFPMYSDVTKLLPEKLFSTVYATPNQMSIPFDKLPCKHINIVNTVSKSISWSSNIWFLFFNTGNKSKFTFCKGQEISEEFF